MIKKVLTVILSILIIISLLQSHMIEILKIRDQKTMQDRKFKRYKNILNKNELISELMFTCKYYDYSSIKYDTFFYSIKMYNQDYNISEDCIDTLYNPKNDWFYEYRMKMMGIDFDFNKIRFLNFLPKFYTDYVNIVEQEYLEKRQVNVSRDSERSFFPISTYRELEKHIHSHKLNKHGSFQLLRIKTRINSYVIKCLKLISEPHMQCSNEFFTKIYEECTQIALNLVLVEICNVSKPEITEFEKMERILSKISPDYSTKKELKNFIIRRFGNLFAFNLFDIDFYKNIKNISKKYFKIESQKFENAYNLGKNRRRFTPIFSLIDFMTNKIFEISSLVSDFKIKLYFSLEDIEKDNANAAKNIHKKIMFVDFNATNLDKRENSCYYDHCLLSILYKRKNTTDYEKIKEKLNSDYLKSIKYFVSTSRLLVDSFKNIKCIDFEFTGPLGNHLSTIMKLFNPYSNSSYVRIYNYFKWLISNSDFLMNSNRPISENPSKYDFSILTHGIRSYLYNINNSSSTILFDRFLNECLEKKIVYSKNIKYENYPFDEYQIPEIVFFLSQIEEKCILDHKKLKYEISQILCINFES